MEPIENGPTITEPWLVAVAGPLRGQTFEFLDGEISIGRVGDQTLTIDDKRVSKRHCVVVQAGGSFKLRDLGSLNGTIVNDEPVTECELRHGDSIRIGNSSFVFLTRDENLVDLPGGVRLNDDALDLTGATALLRDDTLYLNPGRALDGVADARTVKGFAALLQLSTAVRSTQGLAALQDQALGLIVEAIPAEGGAILLTGERPDQLLSTFGRHADGSRDVSVSRTVVRRVIEEKHALLNNDVLASLKDAPSVALSGVGSLLSAPLIVAERVVGAICLTRNLEAPGFEEGDLHLLNALAAILGPALDGARRLDWLEKENRRLQDDLDGHNRMVGDGPAMRRLQKLIRQAAPTDSTVLIRGESGTGKELVARALHRASPRREKPFIAVNCAALQKDLMESDLFGHEKGAFTNAIAQKKGKFEIADGGVIFLDEVAELAPELQVKLLRVLQEREFERVGGLRPIRTDVRVIAATDRNLEDDIRQGRFRHELYYRLNVVSLQIPPLRERPEDILTLAHYFAARYASRHSRHLHGISAETETCLTRYAWPGNVRELQNAIERAVVLGETETILPEDLPEFIVEAHPPVSGGGPAAFHETVRETKRQLIRNALDQAKGNPAEAARLLGLNRTYLHRLIRAFEL